MRYHFKIHKEGKGYWAECVELPGCVTQGDSKKELAENMIEALNLFLAEPSDSKVIFPLPDYRIRPSKTVIPVPVHPRIALAFMVRRSRLSNGWTQHMAKDHFEMKSLFSYQKLESPEGNPEFETIQKIKKVFPEIKLDEVLDV